jgi:WS/DGAT/MGAT family acyltransferase
MTKFKQTMSNVDTAWLQMDRPTNLMMIAGFMAFDGPVDFERVSAAIERRLLTFDRFRQRVAPPRFPLGSHHWERDPHFDIRAHVHRVALPAPGDRAALQAFMSDLTSTPLDRSRPLWQFTVVEGYGDGWVLAARLHHAIADGIALMRVLLSLTDFSADSPPGDSPLAPVERPEDRQRGLLGGAIGLIGSAVGAVGNTATSLARATLGAADVTIQQGLETVRHPGRLVDLARLGADNATMLAKMALRSPDPQTIFRGELGVTKRCAWGEPLPLAEVKRVGRALGGTVNDVLMATVAGALRRYMLERNQLADGVGFRAFVPVNLRSLDAPLELGNRFGLVFPTLPVGLPGVRERFEATRAEMEAIKDSPEAIVAYGVLYALGMTPMDIEGVFLDFFGSKSTLVMTNVPGPQIQLYFAGSPMREIMAWVPQSGGLGMGVSIISYNGGVFIGVTTDAGLVPDPERIIDNVLIEFEAQRLLADEVAG